MNPPTHSEPSETGLPANMPVSLSERTDSGGRGILDLVLILASNLRLLLLLPLTAGSIAWTVGFLMGPVYTASTTFLPPQQQQSTAAIALQQLGGLGSLAGAAGGLKNPNDQFMALLRTRSVQETLITRFKLQERYGQKMLVDARKILDDSTRIGAGRDGLITIDLTDRDATVAAEMANAYVDELSRLLRTLVVSEAQRRREFFEGQLTLSKQNLTKAEQALKSTGISPSAVKGRPEAAVSAIAAIQARISTQEVRLGSMRSYLSEHAAEVRQAQQEFASLKTQLDRAGRADIASPGDTDYIARYRDFKYHETLFELLARQFEIARVDESREGGAIQVIDRAVPPERRSGPKRALMAIVTTLVVAFALMLWLLSRELLTDAVRSPGTSDKLRQLASVLRLRTGRG